MSLKPADLQAMLDGLLLNRVIHQMDIHVSRQLAEVIDDVCLHEV